MHEVEKAYAREYLSRWLKPTSWITGYATEQDTNLIYQSIPFNERTHEDGVRPTSVEVAAVELLSIIYLTEYCNKENTITELCEDGITTMGDRLLSELIDNIGRLNQLTGKNFPLPRKNEFPSSETKISNQNKSDKLTLLIQAAQYFWANADRADRTTHPDNKAVVAWLIERGYTETLASKAATIIRPEWAVTGRKPEK